MRDWKRAIREAMDDLIEPQFTEEYPNLDYRGNDYFGDKNNEKGIPWDKMRTEDMGRALKNLVKKQFPNTPGSLTETKHIGPISTSVVRVFESGASRGGDLGKLDYEGFLSPIVLKRYAEYLHKHRILPDGTTRPSDNWQKGIPVDTYIKSLWRHMMDVMLHHDGYHDEATETQLDSLCGIIFNAMGILYELEKKSYEYRNGENTNEAQ